MTPIHLQMTFCRKSRTLLKANKYGLQDLRPHESSVILVQDETLPNLPADNATFTLTPRCRWNFRFEIQVAIRLNRKQAKTSYCIHNGTLIGMWFGYSPIFLGSKWQVPILYKTQHPKIFSSKINDKAPTLSKYDLCCVYHVNFTGCVVREISILFDTISS